MRLATSAGSAPPMPSDTTKTALDYQGRNASACRVGLRHRARPRLLSRQIEDQKIVLVATTNTANIRLGVQLYDHREIERGLPRL